MSETPYAWLGDVETFLATTEEDILQALTRFARETGSPQLFAWDRSLRTLRSELAQCMPGAAGFALVLEYELPRAGGRRPDLIVLENGIVLVIEFKNRVETEPGDIDQVKSYVRDLEDDHSSARGRQLIPVLVPIGMDREPFARDGVRVVPPRGLGGIIRELAGAGSRRRGDAQAWVNAVYEPLPALVEAARLLFERKPLPRIRRAESAGIPETVDYLRPPSSSRATGPWSKCCSMRWTPGCSCRTCDRSCDSMAAGMAHCRGNESLYSTKLSGRGIAIASS